jgi:hypothetical protein
MTAVTEIELFILKCAVLNKDLRRVLNRFDETRRVDEAFGSDTSIREYILQFDLQNRINASNMAEYYKIFYMLENDIRRLISDTLEAAHGADWWNTCVPLPVKEEVAKNQKRELDAGIALRSENALDYTTFGQLGDIIRANWTDFAGMLSNQSALNRVLFSLNMSRGTIAHCGVLAEDEIDRLKLNVKDWFRVLAGPAK